MKTFAPNEIESNAMLNRVNKQSDPDFKDTQAMIIVEWCKQRVVILSMRMFGTEWEEKNTQTNEKKKEKMIWKMFVFSWTLSYVTLSSLSFPRSLSLSL